MRLILLYVVFVCTLTSVYAQVRDLLKLVMMVKNEAHTIEATLNSTIPYIDSWLILDTGSTDGTQDIITTFFDAHNVKGKLIEQPFIDFSTSRNYALQSAEEIQDSTWFLLLDGDDYLVNASTMRQELQSLTPSNYKCAITRWRWNGEYIYKVIKIVRSESSLRFRGRVHESLPAGECTLEHLNFFIDHNVTEQSSSTSSKRWERDVALLEQDLLDHQPHELQYIRSTFYLAQTYNWLKNKDKAYYYYDQRTKLGGWDEEIYQSYLHLGHLTESKSKRKELWLKAYKLLPDRAEALYYIAKDYEDTKRWKSCYVYASKANSLGIPNRMLDVNVIMYTLYIPLLVSHCAYYPGHIQEGWEATLKGLSSHPEQPNLINNYKFYKDLLTTKSG